MLDLVRAQVHLRTHPLTGNPCDFRRGVLFRSFLLRLRHVVVPYLLALSLLAEHSVIQPSCPATFDARFPWASHWSRESSSVVEIAARSCDSSVLPMPKRNDGVALVVVVELHVIEDHCVSMRDHQHRMAHASGIVAVGTAVEVAGSAVGEALWGFERHLSRLGALHVLRQCSTSRGHMSSGMPPSPTPMQSMNPMSLTKRPWRRGPAGRTIDALLGHLPTG